MRNTIAADMLAGAPAAAGIHFTVLRLLHAVCGSVQISCEIQSMMTALIERPQSGPGTRSWMPGSNR